MNEFRKKLLGGPGPEAALLRGKPRRMSATSAPEEESFAELAIPRTAPRSANHRGGDRHRLADAEQVVLLHDGDELPVRLINLSGGGAMIEGAGDLKLWSRVELQLGGPSSRLEAVVRWIKGDRIGLEFAHETRIAADQEEVADTLREVIGRSFPDVAIEASAAAAVDAAAAVEAAENGVPPPPKESDADILELGQRELRHPLIWSGLVHFNHDSIPCRLRNISTGGALIESAERFPVGAELLLDLGEAGAIFSTVHWARGDQVGLRFHTSFDLKALAKARPEVAGARWTAPDYLREDRSANSPWASQWDRSDLAGLHRGLELRHNRLRPR